MMTVNATATIQILRLFYDRIKGADNFYCGVMGSISGLMSSPSAAVYAASKAAICRLIESVNIELEVAGTKNRILNVSPASFKGSRFYGGQNQLELLEELAEEIIGHLFAADILFIPQYEETFKAVLECVFKSINPSEKRRNMQIWRKTKRETGSRCRISLMR
ncbi:MAG: SDR family NAD(P)-dependent oxidoreductase [Clostridia bacterium]|nr:SDR family NAD(P)-dependent oxidoreductase [Clostridia bacterium]